MAIIKFDPVRNPLEFANEINRRVMRDLYGENGNAWRPSLDVSETNDSYVVKAEVRVSCLETLTSRFTMMSSQSLVSARKRRSMKRKRDM